MKALLLIALTAVQLVAPVASQQTHSDARDATAIRDFQARVASYAAVRNRLASGIHRPTEARLIADYERRLGDKVRAARSGAKPGEFFTREIHELFKRLLASSSPEIMALQFDDVDTDADDVARARPDADELQINATYPEGAPRSRVPLTVLARLPSLPADIQYRFSGRDLLLHDVRANIILDVMRNAAQ